MEPVIWIEVVSSQCHVLSRFRVEKPTIRIGRGYHNDVVLDDPFVASDHLVVEMDKDGRILARDMDSLNGIYLVGSKTSQKQIELDGDKIIRLGQTLLRVRTSAAAVTPERILKLENHKWSGPLLPFVSLCLLSNLLTWLDASAPLKLSNFLLNIFVIVPVLVWAGFWSVLSRVFSGTAHFGDHVRFACVLFLGFMALNRVDAIMSYALATSFIDQYIYVLFSVLFGYSIFKSLRLVGHSGTKWKAIIVVGFTLICLVLPPGMSALEPRITTKGDFVTYLEPPVFRLVSPQPKKDFLAKVAHLKNELDKDRQKDPPADARRFE